jgi:hypothetical protein
MHETHRRGSVAEAAIALAAIRQGFGVFTFAAYCEELNRCFFLPIDRFDRRTAISLRLGPSRNNQAVGVNWADDYDFASLPLHWRP